jgi:cell division septation protein DedD
MKNISSGSKTYTTTLLILLISAVLMMLASVSYVLAAPYYAGVIVDNGVDDFYYDGQTVTFNVSVVWGEDPANPGIGTNLTINCSNLGGAGAVLAVNTTPIGIGATNFTANCTVNYAASSGVGTTGFNPLIGENITFTAMNASNSTGGTNTTVLTGVIIPYNFTTPIMAGAQLRFGSSTTSLATQTNFNTVNYLIYVEMNGSFANDAWSGFEQVCLYNFTSLNMTNQLIGQQMALLPTYLVVNISQNPQIPSYIYVNSTGLLAFNTTTKLTLNKLPFTSMPTVATDGSVNTITSYSYNSTGLGTLLFTVNHFSQYNITDNTTPIITLINPVNASSVSVNITTLNMTFNGTGSVLNTSTIQVNLTYTGGSITLAYASFTGCSPDSTAEKYSNCINVSSQLPDGVVNITAYVKDNAGNAASKAFEYTIQAAAPTINYVNLTSNLSKTQGTVFVTVNASSSLGYIANVTVAGQRLGNTSTINSTHMLWNGTINVSLPFPGGVLTVIATSNSGATTTTNTPTIIIDNTAPTTTATIVTTAGGTVDTTDATWYNVNINVTLAAADTGGATLDKIMYRNGTTGSWVLWTVNMSIAENITENILQFRSNDSLGNTESYQSKYVKVDKTAPSAVISSLSSTLVGPGQSVQISTTLSDALSGFNASTAIAYLNNSPSTTAVLSLSAGKYVGTLTAPTAAGTYLVTVNASDNAGNKNSSETTAFTVTSAIPTFNSGTANNTYAANLSSVTFYAYNATNVWYNWTQGGAGFTNLTTNTSGAYSFSVLLNFLCQNIMVNLHANNSDGYISNTTYVYLTDSTPPPITISGPTDGLRVNGTTTITAVSTDPASGTANVSFYIGIISATPTLRSTDTTSPYTYSWNTLTESGNGNYSINATAIDNAGNMNSTIIYVTVNNSAATQVTVSAGTADFAGTAVATYLDQVTGLNSTTAKAVVQTTAIISSPTVGGYTADIVFLSINISADTSSSATVKFKLPKTTAGLSSVLDNLYAFTTHSDGTTEKYTVTHNTANDDASNYAFNFTTTKFSIFTIATQKSTTVAVTGGSGGGGSSTTVISITGTELRKSLTVGSSLKFVYSGAYHTITLNSISNGKATITVASTAKTFALSPGEGAKVDVDDDGTYDIKIVLVSTSASSSALLGLKTTSGTVSEVTIPVAQPAPTPVEQPVVQPEAKPETVTAPPEKPAPKPVAEKKEEKKAEANMALLIGIIVAVVLLAVGLGAYFAKRRPPHHKHH